MKSRRVAITGLGVVSSLGRGKDAFWGAVIAGRSGAAPVASFDTSAYRTHAAAEIKDFSPRGAVDLALAAAKLAIEDSGLDLARLEKDRVGVALGTTTGEAVRMELAMGHHLKGRSLRALYREAFPDFPASIPARLARELGLRGPNVMLATACCAGNSAIACGFEKIVSGRADLMLAGGVDVISTFLFAGFNRLLAMAPQFCAPFSKDRKGLIAGEGCAILILEEMEAAVKRSAPVYAELLGYGLSSDAHHVTMPHVDGVSRSISMCLENSGLKPTDVDYISAHGTGTPANDKTETAAIKKVFGDKARSVPISSIKSMIGHTMGAASAFEAVACCMALKTGWVPPTINFTPGDPDCDLDYVPNQAREVRPSVVISNAFAFGGSNAVIAMAKPGSRKRAPRPAPPVRVVVTGIGTVEAGDPLKRAEEILPEKDLGYLDEPMAYALCGVKLALEDAGLADKVPSERVGIILDSSGELGSLFKFYQDLADQGPVGVEPRLFPNILANAAASRAAIAFGLKLVNISISGSFPGGESALIAAVDFLRRHGDGIILAGGVEEGAALFVVETLAGAKKRGARIYAEVADYAETFEPQSSPGDPGCFCLAKALKKISKAKRPMAYKARGLWGGRIGLNLSSLSTL